MIVGVDIGTQSMEVVITDNHLTVLGEAASAYQPTFPKPGWAEQNPNDWEQALAPTIAQALDSAALKPGNIRALGIGEQLDGCVAIDKKGRPVHHRM